MNIFRLAFLALLLSLAKSALASECGQPISVDAVIKLSGTITLSDLKAKFGEWCQGHGPVSWYKGAHGKEIWFWWEKPSQPATTDAEGMKYHVLVATEVPSDNENVQSIIWPPKFVGKEMADVYPGYRRQRKQ